MKDAHLEVLFSISLLQQLVNYNISEYILWNTESLLIVIYNLNNTKDLLRFVHYIRPLRLIDMMILDMC